MSLINDALKEARRNPPRTPPSLSPLAPIPPEDSTPILTWLIPALVILLIVAGIFFIGWTSANHTVRKVDNDPAFAASTQKAAEVVVPVVAVSTDSPVPVRQPDAPLLQGIFYSVRNPSAIVNGKTVGLGDRVEGYRVKEISKYTVTLVGDDGKSVKIGMSN